MIGFSASEEVSLFNSYIILKSVNTSIYETILRSQATSTCVSDNRHFPSPSDNLQDPNPRIPGTENRYDERLIGTELSFGRLSVCLAWLIPYHK